MCMAVLAYYPHGAALHVGVGTLEAYTTALSLIHIYSVVMRAIRVPRKFR